MTASNTSTGEAKSTVGSSVATPLSVELDRGSPVPLYFQLAQAIEAAILGGQLAPGDRFENELALAKRLNLSRPTTRRAIQELVDKGLLVRKRGVGTQVVQSPVHRPVELTSLFDDLARAGQAPSTKLLDYHVGIPTAEVARELNLGEDVEVVTIRRLRSTNGEPLALMTNHLPSAIAPDPEELEHASYSTVVGLLLWAVQHRHAGATAFDVTVAEPAMARLRGWLSRLSPRRASPQPGGALAT